MSKANEVYVLIENWYEWRELKGVFTSRYRARRAMTKHPDNYSVEKVVLNEHIREQSDE